MTDDDFISYLVNDCAYHRVERIGADRWVAINPLMFHWTMMVGKMGDVTGFDNKYCYENKALAVKGLEDWKATGYEGEPIGWHRNTETGRRRPGGDPQQEYIEW